MKKGDLVRVVNCKAVKSVNRFWLDNMKTSIGKVYRIVDMSFGKYIIHTGKDGTGRLHCFPENLERVALPDSWSVLNYYRKRESSLEFLKAYNRLFQTNHSLVNCGYVYGIGKNDKEPLKSAWESDFNTKISIKEFLNLVKDNNEEVKSSSKEPNMGRTPKQGTIRGTVIDLRGARKQIAVTSRLIGKPTPTIQKSKGT